MSYFIGCSNTFVNPNTPVVIEFGEYNLKSVGFGLYPCITKFSTNQYNLSLIDDSLYKINRNTVQAAEIGSKSVLVYDLINANAAPQLFSFFVYESPLILSQEALLNIINQELPTIYKSSNVLNNADNSGISAVMAAIYKEVYSLFYNVITSIGSGNKYNTDWEYVYVGINNFLQNAIYPAEFIKTLMQVNSKTSIQIPQMAILISKLAFQFTGEISPIYIYYDLATDTYYINIYNSISPGWQLGVSGRSELGVTTFLNFGQTTGYLYILSVIIGRLMPIQVKYLIGTYTIDDFNTAFNINDVDVNDYIDSSVNYDAYAVVNNNNIFNTQGYYHV